MKNDNYNGSLRSRDNRKIVGLGWDRNHIIITTLIKYLEVCHSVIFQFFVNDESFFKKKIHLCDRKNKIEIL